MASKARVIGSTDPTQPSTAVEERQQLLQSTREQEMKNRAYEIYLQGRAQPGSRWRLASGRTRAHHIIVATTSSADGTGLQISVRTTVVAERARPERSLLTVLPSPREQRSYQCLTEQHVYETMHCCDSCLHPESAATINLRNFLHRPSFCS